MHKKKHHQFKDININTRRGIRVGGVFISAMPGYWGGGSDENHETPSQEAAEHAPGGSEASEGASATSGDGAAAGTSAGAGSAGGM
jgi:hypothetical protein